MVSIPANRTPNACGGCTICCSVLQINDVPGGPSPAGCTCPFVKDKGCSIYAKRPNSCQSFECLYIKLARRPDIATSAALRPDNSGVMFVHNPSRVYFTAHVWDPKRTDAWREEEPMNVIKRLTQDGFKVVVTFGPTPRKYLLEGDGQGGIIETILTMGDPDDNGVQSVQVLRGM